MGFFSFVRLLYGTGWLGPHQQYGAEGAALGSQSEPSTSYHIATEFFIFVSLPTTTGGGGSGRAGGGGAARGCAVVPHQSPTTQPNYALQVCFSRRKLIRGSEKSTVDLFLLIDIKGLKNVQAFDSSSSCTSAFK